MRLVEQQPGGVLLLQLDQRRQVDDVAVHREQALGDDQRVLVLAAMLAHQRVEVIKVVVVEHDHFALRRAAAGDDRVVGEFVEEDDTAVAHDVRDHGDVGEVARDERHDLLDADELRQGALEILVAVALATDETGGQGADADALHRRNGRGLDRGVAAQTEVVVVGERGEAIAPCGGVLACLVDGYEEGIVLHEVVAAGEPEALLGIVGKVLLLLHGYRNLRWVVGWPRRSVDVVIEGYHCPISQQEHGRHARHERL